MKQPKKLSRQQKIILNELHLNAKEWMLLSENKSSFTIVKKPDYTEQKILLIDYINYYIHGYYDNNKQKILFYNNDINTVIDTLTTFEQHKNEPQFFSKNNTHTFTHFDITYRNQCIYTTKKGT